MNFIKTLAKPIAVFLAMSIMILLTPGQIAAGGNQVAVETAMSYDQARWHPIHFKPGIDAATDDQCLECHGEILERKPLMRSSAGVSAADSVAWYQTLDTYDGEQSTFHQRHVTSAYAKKVMRLSCNFCHQGHDPREEASGNGTQPQGGFSLRKMVDPEKTCLMCHGKFPVEFMVGLEGPWLEARQDLEDEETPNGCLTCHEEMYRTVRHQVSYLKPKAIEEAAKKSSDVCFGCHGGRQWYRINFPYPRHPWPDMNDFVEETPDWAKTRSVESDPRYRIK